MDLAYHKEKLVTDGYTIIDDVLPLDLALSINNSYKNNDQWDKSNVEFESGKIIEYNKQQPNQNMHYIDYGLSVLNQSIFDTSILHSQH